MALAKSSTPVAAAYLDLVPPGPDRDRLWQRIRDEHDRAVDAVLTVTRSGELLDRHPVLQRTIARRNPFVDALNAAQVALLARLRDPALDEEAHEAVRGPLGAHHRRHRGRAAQHGLRRGYDSRVSVTIWPGWRRTCVPPRITGPRVPSAISMTRQISPPMASSEPRVHPDGVLRRGLDDRDPRPLVVERDVVVGQAGHRQRGAAPDQHLVAAHDAAGRRLPRPSARQGHGHLAPSPEEPHAINLPHGERAFEDRLLGRPRTEHVARADDARSPLERSPQLVVGRAALREHERRDRRRSPPRGRRTRGAASGRRASAPGGARIRTPATSSRAR